MHSQIQISNGSASSMRKTNLRLYTLKNDQSSSEATPYHWHGCHASLVTGYIDNHEITPDMDVSQAEKNLNGGGYLIVKNFWGGKWKDAGYVYLPYTWASAYVFTRMDISDCRSNGTRCKIKILILYFVRHEHRSLNTCRLYFPSRTSPLRICRAS